jgi:hypothetical protein
MERGGSPRRRDTRSVHAGLFLALWAWLHVAALVLYVPGSEKPPVRTVSVKVAADASLSTNEIWKVDIAYQLRDVNMYLRDAIGVKFKIKAFEYWDADPAGRPLASLLPGLHEHLKMTGRGDCDIVVSLVPEGPEGPVDPGVADYLEGVVIIKYLKAKGGMSYVLLHEICHLFGAIDLGERGSVMSLERPTFRIDAFTRAIMLANRERCFQPGKSPLTEDRMAEAISLYSERKALGLGESELAICLHHLQAFLSRMQATAGRR